MQSDIIADFVAGLIKKAGLDKVPQGFHDEYAEKIKAEAQKRLGIIALRELTPEAVDKFGELVGRDAKPEELAEFFKNNIPDYEKKVTEALEQFADEFLASAAKLKAAI
jgi:hypothetical protein